MSLPTLKVSQIEPLNGTVLVKIPKVKSTLLSAGGLLVAGVEQDFCYAEVLAVPKNPRYETILRDQFGTPLARDEDGNPVVSVQYVTVNAGDYVLMEKRFHHEYDVRRRDRVDHTICINDRLEIEDGDVYDYCYTTANDILMKVDKETAMGDEIISDLYSTMTPKPITRTNDN